MSLFSLKNKSILITGSSKGIGKSIAHQSALMGANVIISSRKMDACEETAKEINDDINPIIKYSCNHKYEIFLGFAPNILKIATS